MRKVRKGFTLVELLIVIAVIGILGAMAMMSGKEATDIATATRIVEDFKLISAAMNMYYADNKVACDKGLVKVNGTNAALNASIVKTGLGAYMKSTDSLSDSTSANNTGKYLITINNDPNDRTWWLTYTLSQTDVKIAQILANKAVNEGFVDSVGSSTTYAVVMGTQNTSILAKKTICYKVR